MNLKALLPLFVLTCLFIRGWAQDTASAVDKGLNFPSSFFSRIDHKTASLEDRLTKQTEKYLQRLAKRERTLKHKLSKIDSTAFQKLFANSAPVKIKGLITLNTTINRYKCDL